METLLVGKVGGIFVSLKCNCAISYGTFEANTSDLGGVLYIESEVMLDAKYTDFMNNRAESHGGSIFGAEFVQIHLRNSTLYNNRAMNGGAVLLIVHWNVTNTKFTGNHTSIIYARASLLGTNAYGTFLSCKFYNNTAENNGGALLIKNTMLAEVYNCTFTGNIAAKGGGVYMEDIQAARIADSNFTENSADTMGGGVVFSDQVTGNITNCNFDKNLAQHGGACGIISFVKLDTVNCRFKNNYAHASGGAINAANNASLHISKNIFFPEQSQGLRWSIIITLRNDRKYFSQ